MLRATGIRSGVFCSRTFNEAVRKGDFVLAVNVDAAVVRPNNIDCRLPKCRRDGRRRISIAVSVLHSSMGNGMSYVKCREP